MKGKKMQIDGRVEEVKFEWKQQARRREEFKRKRLDGKKHDRQSLKSPKSYVRVKTIRYYEEDFDEES